MKVPIISFVILTWNSEKYLGRCFDSIISTCNREQISLEVIVIDNGSHDSSVETVDRFKSMYGDLFHLIALASNMGTTYPRNLGLKKSQGEYVCIIDSDTELGEGSLKVILHTLSSDRSIGIVAPRLLLPDRSIQNSVKRFPTLLHKLSKIPKILFGMKLQNYDFYDTFPFVRAQTVDSAISACWFFRRELLETVGFLDEQIFYAPEDVDYSLRVWKAGFSILYDPEFTVLHHTQQITHRKPFSKTSLSHFAGLLYYYRKHGGWVKKPQFSNGDLLNVK